jgi:replicative DNA helicase
VNEARELEMLGEALQNDEYASQLLSLVALDEWSSPRASALARWLQDYMSHGGPCDPSVPTATRQHRSVTDAGPAVVEAWAAAKGADASIPQALGYYVGEIRLAAARRRLHDAATALLALASRHPEGLSRASLAAEASEILDRARLVDGMREGDATSLGEAWAAERARRANGGGAALVMPTGVAPLDEQLGGGLRPGQLVVIGGRPGMGKTALALQCAIHVAGHVGRVGVFSMEMSHLELDLRAVSFLSYVSANAIEEDDLTTDETDAVLSAEEVMRTIPIKIIDRPGLTLAEIVSQSRLWAKTGGLSMIVVDHLGLMKHAKADRHDLALADTTRLLKALAKTLEIPVVLLVQMNRDFEKRAGAGGEPGWRGQIARPRMADLRDSGGIEADADIVMFPLRPTRGLVTKENELEAQIDIVKARRGGVGVVDVAWDGPCTAFRAPSGVGPMRDDEML